jgi:hypothetical protein
MVLEVSVPDRIKYGAHRELSQGGSLDAVGGETV